MQTGFCNAGEKEQQQDYANVIKLKNKIKTFKLCVIWNIFS